MEQITNMTITLALALLSVFVLGMDCHQTLNIKKHPDQHETNHFLGLHPSDALVIRYFLAYIALVVVGYFYTPASYYIGACIGVIGLETYVIYGNYKLGL